MEAAYYCGYSHATCNAPILPSNGIKENDYRIVKLKDAFHLNEVKVAGNIYDADAPRPSDPRLKELLNSLSI